MPGHSLCHRRLPVLTTALLAAGVLGATSPSILLDDLSQRPTAEPATFQVTGTIALDGLRWSHWGATTANGRGDLRINTCQPSCADGRLRVLPGSELQVRGVRVDHGQRYYGQYRILNRAFSAADRAAYSQWTVAYVPGDFR